MVKYWLGLIATLCVTGVLGLAVVRQRAPVAAERRYHQIRARMTKQEVTQFLRKTCDHSTHDVLRWDFDEGDKRILIWVGFDADGRAEEKSMRIRDAKGVESMQTEVLSNETDRIPG